MPGIFPVALGINDSNAIVGTNYISNVAEGFLFQNGTFHRLVFKGSKWTAPNGINDDGEVVGWFNDADGTPQGFTWTPPAAAAK